MNMSSGFRQYSPQAIMLPAHGALSRTFYDTRQHLPGRPPLEPVDYDNFERLTLFNDVFIHTGGEDVVAVGPPLVNLKSQVLPLRASVLGQDDRVLATLRHRMRHFDRVTVHRFRLPESMRGAEELTLRLQFATGQTHQLSVRRQILDPVGLQFVTLQKNNPVTWILDWIAYGRHLGVERFILYDNGSDNAQELAEALQQHALHQLSSRCDVVLVHWPYPYGPVRSYYNQFCQATQNNHAHHCFGQAHWTGHFDIDEYPVTQTGDATGALSGLLNSVGSRTGLLRFDSYWVPNLLSEEPLNGQPSVRDFLWRERLARGRAHKYLVRSSALRMANTHNGKLRPGFFRRSMAPAEWAFLHYKSLTTNWRDYASRGLGEARDEALHIADQRVADVMRGLDQGSTR